MVIFSIDFVIFSRVQNCLMGICKDLYKRLCMGTLTLGFFLEDSSSSDKSNDDFSI